MKKFIFKSTEADLQKICQSIDTIRKNVLYLTYQVDFIRRKVTALDIDKGLQTQVSEYYTDKAVPESV